MKAKNDWENQIKSSRVVYTLLIKKLSENYVKPIVDFAKGVDQFRFAGFPSSDLLLLW